MLSQLIIIAVLIVTNAFFSSEAMAKISVNKNKIRIKADAGN